MKAKKSPVSKRKSFFSFFLNLFLVFSVSASQTLDPENECFLLIKGGPRNGIYRISTQANGGPPIGFICNPGEDVNSFVVDKNGTIHLFYVESETDFSPYQGSLLRQVFDGIVSQASWGSHSMEHQDKRSFFSPNEGGKPIFRPLGAPHSVGPGVRVPTPSINPLPPGDLVFTGKNWYSLPNCSWYQTWDSVSASGEFSKTYRVYFDQLEVRKHVWREKTWSEERGNFFDQGIIASFQEERVLRGAVSACLDECGGFEKRYLSENSPFFTDFFRILHPETGTEKRYFCGGIQGRDSFRILFDGSLFSGKIIGGFEGNPYTRNHVKPSFFGSTLGKDLNECVYLLNDSHFSSWYKELWNPSTENFSTELTVFASTQDGLSAVYVYGKPQGRIFKFERDETANPTLLKDRYESQKIGNDLDDLIVDRSGRLLFSRLYSIPQKAPNNFDMNKDGLLVLDDGNQGNSKESQGRLVFAQQFSQVVYTCKFTRINERKLGEVSLGCRYFARSFKVPGHNEEIFSSAPIDFEKKLFNAGGRWEGWNVNLKEFQDSFVRPQKIRVSGMDLPSKSPDTLLATESLEIVGPFVMASTDSKKSAHVCGLSSPNLRDEASLLEGTPYFFIARYVFPDGSDESSWFFDPSMRSKFPKLAFEWRATRLDNISSRTWTLESIVLSRDSICPVLLPKGIYYLQCKAFFPNNSENQVQITVRSNEIAEKRLSKMLSILDFDTLSWVKENLVSENYLSGEVISIEGVQAGRNKVARPDKRHIPDSVFGARFLSLLDPAWAKDFFVNQVGGTFFQIASEGISFASEEVNFIGGTGVIVKDEKSNHRELVFFPPEIRPADFFDNDKSSAILENAKAGASLLGFRFFTVHLPSFDPDGIVSKFTPRVGFLCFTNDQK